MPWIDIKVEHNVSGSSKSIDLMSNRMETLLVIRHTRMMLYIHVLITKRWFNYNSVSTMLEQFATVKLHVKILTQFCMLSLLRFFANSCFWDNILSCDMNRGLFRWTTSWCFNEQLTYSCAITPFSHITKQHLAPKHTKIQLQSMILWIGIELCNLCLYKLDKKVPCHL